MSGYVQIDKAPWLHIYGQHTYHAPAVVRGNREALTKLRDAIDVALVQGEATSEAFASDGEGYEVKVQRVNTMATLGSPEYLFEREYEMARREHERQRQFKLPPSDTPSLAGERR